MGRKYQFYAAKIHLAEKRELLVLLESIYESLPTLSIPPNYILLLRSGVTSLISAVYIDLGSIPALLLLSHSVESLAGQIETAAAWFGFSLSSPPSYATLQTDRSDWIEQQRSTLSRDRHGKLIVHFFTVASENQTELQNLLTSAKLSGIQLKVLGLGREYLSYTQKIDWYYEEIVENGSYIAESDLVVLVDAYDVIFTPAVRTIGEVPLTRFPSSSFPGLLEDGGLTDSNDCLCRERHLPGTIFSLVLSL